MPLNNRVKKESLGVCGYTKNGLFLGIPCKLYFTAIRNGICFGIIAEFFAYCSLERCFWRPQMRIINRSVPEKDQL